MSSFLPSPSSHSFAPGAPGRRRRSARPPRPLALALRYPSGRLTCVVRQYGRQLLAALGLLFLLWTTLVALVRRGGRAWERDRLTVHGHSAQVVVSEHNGGLPSATAPSTAAAAASGVTAGARQRPAVKASALELQEKWAADDDAAEAEEVALRSIVAARRARAANRQEREGKREARQQQRRQKDGPALPRKPVQQWTAGRPGGKDSGSGMMSSGHAGVPSGRISSSPSTGRAAARDEAGDVGKRRASLPRPPLRAVAAGERLADLPETDNGELAMLQGARRSAAAAVSAGGRMSGWPVVRLATAARPATGGTKPTDVALSVPAAAVTAAVAGEPAGNDVDDVGPRADDSPFRGVPLSAVDASVALLSDVATNTNVTRLSYMLYRLVITAGATSLLDVPCTSHLAWMPPLLERLDFEIPGFEYTCMDASGELPPAAGAAFSRLASATVLLNTTYWALDAPPLPRVDLVWSWGGLEGLSLDDAYTFFQRVHASGSRRLAVGNWPRLNNVVIGGGGHYHGRPALGRPLPPAMNLRGSPFLFGQAERVIGGLDDSEANSGNTVEGRPTRKQLLVYDTRKMRESW
ncbi:hypothetical protein MMPV_006799 [Pyropia vietnamensis]